ncbi:ATP-binding protein [Micropruina sp.]|uniref:sensor histidine kinase n=1 Tax=Micropruina sp. TaxID=2737536 RepID=UPI00260D9750|nr:ATP-binding protein [Micropruina sp.]
MTLRARFALWICLMMLATLGAFGAFVYFSVSHWLSSSLDDSLRLGATQLIATADVDDGKLQVDDDPVILDAGLTDELRSRGLSIQIFGPSGAVLQSLGPYASLAVEPAVLREALAGRSSLHTRPDPEGTGSVRVLTQPMLIDGKVGAVIQIAESLRSIDALRERLLLSLLLGSPMIVAAAGVGGYYLAGRALRPIDHIVATARRISAHDLTERLGLPPSRDEVGRLAGTFDEMLGRLDEAFQRERRFSNDAAHELRTPLAAMQSILSVIAEQRRTPAEYEAALADLSEETDKLRALTDDLLRLARAEASEPLWEPVDLAELVPEVVDSLRPLTDADRVRLTCLTEGDASVVGDTDALIRLLVNLLDNAIKHTPAGSIAVTVRGLPDEVRIAVTDTGDGIAAEHLPHVFDRFYRAEESRTTAGTGLGLAICREIVHTHGGDIEVTSEPGAGSTFTVRLSRDPRS